MRMFGRGEPALRLLGNAVFVLAEIHAEEIGRSNNRLLGETVTTERATTAMAAHSLEL